MHLLNSVAETVQDKSPNNPGSCVESIAGACKIYIRLNGIIGDQVIGAVVDPFETIHGVVVVSFAHVILNDIENDLDVRSMKGLDHFTELITWLLSGLRPCIRMVRRKKADRHIAPVIPFLRIDLKHEHQLDCRDA